MTDQYQCLPCQTTATEAGVCGLCDDPFMQIVNADAPERSAPAPDWPDEEIDSANHRTVRKAPAHYTRTRKGRV